MAIELFIAVNALGGAIYGLAGAEDVPREWLEGSPFESYVVPSMALLVGVCGGMSAAAAAVLLRHPRAAEISVAAGLVLFVWLAVEVLIIPFSWLQPAFFALGLIVVALALRLRTVGPKRGRACPRS